MTSIDQRKFINNLTFKQQWKNNFKTIKSLTEFSIITATTLHANIPRSEMVINWMWKMHHKFYSLTLWFSTYSSNMGIRSFVRCCCHDDLMLNVSEFVKHSHLHESLPNVSSVSLMHSTPSKKKHTHSACKWRSWILSKLFVCVFVMIRNRLNLLQKSNFIIIIYLDVERENGAHSHFVHLSRYQQFLLLLERGENTQAKWIEQVLK